VPEAKEPASAFSFKGNIDLVALERVLHAHRNEEIAFVRQEACLNMAGGQPFSLDNLTAVRALTLEYGVPFFLDATRLSENAVFVKDREAGQADRAFGDLLRAAAELSDGAVFSSKKDHFVPIGGFLALNDDPLAERARELLVLYEGFAPTSAA
jgi:tyrosine phenol-lyase